MPRGRTRGSYVSDILGASFTVDVPDNLFAEVPLGWAAAPAGQIKLPKRLRPRHAIGLSATTGRRARVTVADITATLWTRAATTWTSISNDGTVDTYTLTGLVGEAVTL